MTRDKRTSGTLDYQERNDTTEIENAVLGLSA